MTVYWDQHVLLVPCKALIWLPISLKLAYDCVARINMLFKADYCIPKTMWTLHTWKFTDTEQTVFPLTSSVAALYSLPGVRGAAERPPGRAWGQVWTEWWHVGPRLLQWLWQLELMHFRWLSGTLVIQRRQTQHVDPESAGTFRPLVASWKKSSSQRRAALEIRIPKIWTLEWPGTSLHVEGGWGTAGSCF